MPSHEATIPATDEGLLRGDGAFEVIRVYDGRAVCAARPPRPDRAFGSEPSARRCAAERVGERDSGAARGAGRGDFDGCLRIVLTRGGHRILLTEPLPESPERIRLGVVEYAPTYVLDGIKSLSYGANMLCSRLARERGFDEALLVTPQGSVLEAPTSSLFWVDEFGTILTPPLSEHILASITRDRVMRVADVEERPCTHGRPARGAARPSSPRPRARPSRSPRSRASSCRTASAPARWPPRSGSSSTRSWLPADRHGHRQSPAVRQGGRGLPAAARDHRRGDRPHRAALRRRAVADLLRGARRARARA